MKTVFTAKFRYLGLSANSVVAFWTQSGQPLIVPIPPDQRHVFESAKAGDEFTIEAVVIKAGSASC